MRTPLSLTEAVELVKLRAELELAFAEVDKLPTAAQHKGVPAYDRWRAAALEYNSLLRGHREPEKT